MKKNWITEPIPSTSFQVDAKRYMSQDGMKLKKLRRMNRFGFSDGMSGRSIMKIDTFAPLQGMENYRYDK